ncbi:transcriptional regulator, TetR family [Shimia gijangensis]|uniref:Transcriptional regulator, TetR family n=1 Tax=Shimia gijangensis TaxID=1470563 RepID=A0A1M6T774_9RHOB|nr:TetR/AcrR family transcriptional regulator [Shimia gijangensis]SHK52754.1 transcriptional regulator, TetR family [Shimia gijangensis]
MTAKKKPKSERANETRELLLRAAERLYAQRGIDGASLREINREADQKNSSAIHYYFGSRDAVIDGIFQMRASYINARRREALDKINASSEAIVLRDLILGVLMPQVELLGEERGSYFYNRFLAQAALSGQEDVRQLWRSHFSGVLSEFAMLTARCLPDLPADVLRQRLAIHTDFTIYGLAGLERVVEARKDEASGLSIEKDVDPLVDMLCGALSAPATVGEAS